MNLDVSLVLIINQLLTDNVLILIFLIVKHIMKTTQHVQIAKLAMLKVIIF